MKVVPFRSSDLSETVPFISLASFLHMLHESKKKKKEEEEEGGRRSKEEKTTMDIDSPKPDPPNSCMEEKE